MKHVKEILFGLSVIGAPFLAVALLAFPVFLRDLTHDSRWLLLYILHILIAAKGIGGGL